MSSQKKTQEWSAQAGDASRASESREKGMRLKSFRTVLDLDVGESGRSEYRVGESGVTSLFALPQYVELKVTDRRGNRTVLIPYAGIKWMVGDEG